MYDLVNHAFFQHQLFDGLLNSFCLAATEQSMVSGLLENVWNIFRVAVGLGFVVFIHELGHFLAAKSFGVKCEKFYVGFDVPINLGFIKIPGKLFKFQWGETEYGLGAIPLGGYVKMLGQDDDPRKAEEEANRIRNSQEGESEPALDPRSYPAKSVFARMVIISAGVIMNILSAIVIGAIAFFVGVPYTPTLVGSTTPGDAAWQEGIQTGDRIMQIGTMSEPDPQLHFRDMQEQTIFHGLDYPKKEIPLLISRDGEETTYGLIGTKLHDKDRFRMQIGVRMADSTKLHREFTVFPSVADDEHFKDLNLESGDRIVGVNGEMLSVNTLLGVIPSYEFDSIATANFESPLQLMIERPVDESDDANTETLEVELPPVPLKTLGFGVEVNGVTAIQKGSPAAEANVAIGDKIVALNGNPVVDAMTVHLDLLRLAGQSATLTIERSSAATTDSNNNPKESNSDSEAEKAGTDAARIEVQFTVPARPVFSYIPTVTPFGRELYGSGICYDSRPIISRIEPGSSAEAAGLQIGDELAQYKIVASDEEKEELHDKLLDYVIFKETKFSEDYKPLGTQQLAQRLPVGTKFELNVRRNNAVKTVQLSLEASKEYSWPDRFIQFEPGRLIHKTDSVGEACSLGAWLTWKKVTDVYRFLRLAVAGRISRKALGGPATIAVVASSFASEGTVLLLVFLVTLSANLAVLNFLPVPALDGGHMLFLIVEAVTGKPVNEEVQGRLTIVGVCCLLALMVFAIGNDVVNLTELFSR